MNLANKLTLARVIIAPLFVITLLLSDIPYNYLWALILFAAASITDFFDGKIARKRNLVTNFGKFLDPLADKILVISAFVCMIELGWATSWCVALIIAREFMVSGIRLLAAGSDKNLVIAASIWGKLKTAVTMVAIVAILIMHILIQFGVIYDMAAPVALTGSEFPVTVVTDVLMYLATALTVISGAHYLWQYRHFIDTKK